MNLTSRQSATAVLPCPEENSTAHKQNKYNIHNLQKNNNLQTQRTVTKQKHTPLHTNAKGVTILP